MSNVSRQTMCALLLLLAFLAPPLAAPAQAGGGYGHVGAISITDGDISLNWPNPDANKYRYPGTPTFRVCWRKNSRWWVDACNDNSTTTITRPFTINGLSQKTMYKVKVYAWLEKKNIWGNWKGAEWHKVGTLTVETRETSPPQNDIGGHIAATGAGPTAISVSVDVQNGHLLEFVRIAYKKTWTQHSLSFTGRDRDAPANSWTQSDEGRGWVDVYNAPPTVNVDFFGLASNRQYEVAAFGFVTGSNVGIKLGRYTKVHTDRRPRRREGGGRSVIAQYEECMREYATYVSSVCPEDVSLIDHIANDYDLTVADDLAMFESDSDSLFDDFHTIEYLVEGRPDLWARWQNECKLRQNEMNFMTWLRCNKPDVYESVTVDTAPADVDALTDFTGGWQDPQWEAVRDHEVDEGTSDVQWAMDENGPTILIHRQDQLADGFAPGGETDPSVDPLAMAIRLDPGLAEDDGTGTLVSQDDVRCTVWPNALTESPVVSAELEYRLFANSFFDLVREVPLGASVVGTTPDGRAIYGGVVSGQMVDDGAGAVDEERWSFDLPGDGPARPGTGEADEERFFFPGDHIKYLLRATDADGHTTVLGDPSTLAAYDAYDRLEARGLPSIQTDGSQPGCMVILANTDDVSDVPLLQALRENGLQAGRDYDLYRQGNGELPTTNGIASAGRRGATLGQLEGYRAIVLEGGTRKNALTPHSVALPDDADAVLLSDWFHGDKDTGLIVSGTNVLQEMQGAGGAFATLLQNDLGVEVVSSNVRTNTGGDFSPTVSPLPDGLGIFQTSSVADGNCPRVRSFDHIAPLAAGAVATHEFTADGLPYVGQPSAAVLHEQTEMGGGSLYTRRAWSLPTDWAALSSAPGSANDGTGRSTRGRVFAEVATRMGLPFDLNSATSTSAAPTRRTSLQQNSPNPFNPTTRIAFTLDRTGPVSLAVYNLRGEKVRTLMSGQGTSGTHEVLFDGTDDTGARVASGIYMYKLDAPGVQIVKKMALVK